MKKSFSILSSFCLGLFISIAIIACATDDEYNGNNRNLTNPQNEPVAYIKSISTGEGFLDSVVVTYENEYINGWTVEWRLSAGGKFNVNATLQDSCSILITHNGVWRNNMVYTCNCDLRELRDKHVDSYNALISQIMIAWCQQYETSMLYYKY